MTGPEDELLEKLLAEVLAADDPRGTLASARETHPNLAGQLEDAFGRLARASLLPMRDEEGVAERREIGGYRIHGVLGRGGMGIVYRAHDPELGREIALKILRPEFLDFEDSRRRFQREVEVASRLRHPGIVAVHGAGEDDGVPFFTMELVEGTSLAVTVDALRGTSIGQRRGRDLLGIYADSQSGSSGSTPRFAGSWTTACLQVARMVAEALQHAHDQGVFHRDVKPSNILIDRFGRARLLDFGLARLEAAQQLTKSSSTLGSLPYMPPEQFNGRASDYGARQEIYSLGVTLYELLTTRRPFEGTSAEDTRRKITLGEAPPLRRLERSISREVEVVCSTAMDVDPGRRYATVREFADDLDNLLERRPIRARPATPWLRAWRFVQRHPTASIGSALGAALLVASIAAAWNAKLAADVERVGRAQLVDSSLDFFFGFAEGLKRIPGSTEVRVELMQRASEQLEALEKSAGLEVRRLGAIGEAHLALASALGEPGTANLGERDAARARYQHVLDSIAPRIDSNAPEGAALLRAKALIGLGILARFEGELDRSIELHEDAATALEAVLVPTPSTDGELAVDEKFIDVQARLASLAGSQGRHEDALRGFEVVRERKRLRSEAAPDDEGAQFSLARARANCALALLMLGRFEEAVAEYAPLAGVAAARHEASPDDARLAFARIRHGFRYPEILIQAGRFEEGVREARALIEVCEELAHIDPKNAGIDDFRMHLFYDVGWGQQAHAEAMSAADPNADVVASLESARDSFRSALEILHRLEDAGRLPAHVYRERLEGRLGAVELLLESR